MVDHLLNHLEKLMAFKVVAESTSLHKASEKLHISQPSLSATIRLLEGLVEKPLLLRSHRGIQLTTHGEALYKLSQTLFDDYQSFKRDWYDVDGEEKGHLKIGVFESIAVYFWPKFFKEFSRAHADVTLTLKTGRSAALLADLREQVVDLAITVEPSPLKNCLHEPLYEDHFEFYGTPEFAKTWNLQVGANGILTGQALTNLPVVVFSEAVVKSGVSMVDQLASEGIDLQKAIEVGSFEAARELCRQSIGLGFLPTRVANGLSFRPQLLPCRIQRQSALRLFPHKVSASYLKSKKADKLLLLLLTELRQRAI